MQSPKLAIFALLLIGTVSTKSFAADHTAALAPFLGRETFAVMHFDAAAVPAGDPTDLLLLLPVLSEESQSQLVALMAINGALKRFQEAGGQEIYLIMGLADVHLNGGPVLVATAAPGKRLEQVAQMFQELVNELGTDDNSPARDLARRLSVRRQNEVVLVGTAETVKRYDLVMAAERPDFIEPLSRLAGEGAVLAAVFSPGRDFRRVVRELWPELPPPLTPLKGELADRWQRLEFAVNAPPNARPRLVLEASDPAAAQTFVDLYRALPDAARQLVEMGEQRQELARYLDMLVALAAPQIEANRVTLNLSTSEEQINQLRNVFSEIIGMGQQASQNRQRVERFKDISLAMLNYADVKKHYPPAAMRGADGQPLLSWRVAILPYLDGDSAKLYKQFHLDEPWDSPHNRALVDQMPDVFADPDPKLRALAGPGKTTFQVPVGAATVFFKNEGTRLQEVIDGTSKTILIVEVLPQRAVEWTRPADWIVDPQNSRRGIERTDRDKFTAAFADGSVQLIPAKIDAEQWGALLSRGGRELVDRP